MVETYFEGTRFLMLRAREQKFSHFDHDDADGVAVYKVVNPEYMEWLEADNAALRKRVEELEAALQGADGLLYAQDIGKGPAYDPGGELWWETEGAIRAALHTKNPLRVEQ